MALGRRAMPRGAGRRRGGPGGRVRSLDGRLRGVRAVAPIAGSGSRAWSWRTPAPAPTREEGAAGAARSRRGCAPRGTGSWSRARRRCSRERRERGAAQRVRELDRRTSPPTSIAAAALGMAERPDSTPDLAAIDVPTLVDHVGWRHADPARGHLADGRARSPARELAVIEGAGHLSNLEAPAAFDELLARPPGALPAGLSARSPDAGPPVDWPDGHPRGVRRPVSVPARRLPAHGDRRRGRRPVGAGGRPHRVGQDRRRRVRDRARARPAAARPSTPRR